MGYHDLNQKMVGHLFDAVERVRQDVAKVEFWAAAVSEFTQQVPDYQPDDMRGWVPNEQATRLRRPARATEEGTDNAEPQTRMGIKT
jgi:hypothetical protein